MVLLRSAAALAAVMAFCSVLGQDLPDREWLEDIDLLAHSVRDQTVVVQLPGGDTRLLRLGEQTTERYTLRLLKVLDQRIELVATHPQVSDRKLRLWFDPRATSGSVRIASSAVSTDDMPDGPLFQVAPPVIQSMEPEVEVNDP